jgi:prepilin signal peptidase PulO-like enzyme (type II secretory pathway)
MEQYILSGYIFMLGMIIGSFLNVVLYRAYSGKSIRGRSKCGSCNRVLGVIDLFPVLSYLALRGRCRTCGSKISWQYPVVEIVTGIAFLLSYLKAGDTYQLLVLFTLSILAILISVYDIKHTVIPDAWSVAFSITALAWRVPEILAGSVSVGDVLFGGFVMSAALYAVWFLSDGRWIGFGDVKLIFGVGILLGVFGAVMTLWLACIIGALFGMGMLAVQYVHGRVHHTTMQTQIAFGPFILLSVGLLFFEYISLTQLWNMLYIV